MSKPLTAVLAILSLFALCGIGSSAFAQDSGHNKPGEPPSPDTNGSDSEKKSSRKIPPIGAEVGVFEPFSGKVRNRFGDAWFSYGVSFGALRQAKRQGALELEYNLFYSKRGDNSAYVIPIGIDYRRALSTSDTQSTIPYYLLSADVYGTLLKSVPDNIGYGWRTAYGGSAGIGVSFSGHSYLELRYLGVSSVRDFDLSGIQLHGGIRF